MGPLLWNVTYDEVLDKRLPPGCSLLCYADDTLMVVSADSTEEVCRLAEVCSGMLISSIRGLGLRVAAEKTEAILFQPRREPRKEDIKIVVGGHNIKVAPTFKYLRVMIDKS